MKGFNDMHLVRDLVEERRHVAHMLDGEDGVQHLPLLTVVVAYQSLSQSCPSEYGICARTKSCEQTDAENMCGHPTTKVVITKLR